VDSWRIIFKGNEIAVFYGSRYYGDYILLEEPYCQKCAYPGVTTKECDWHWDDYGFERIYAMGAYLSSNTPEGYSDLLSKHIRGLKKFLGYSIPLGLGLAECLRKKYSELLETDLIVPVPLFKTELKISNGVEYNQSVELSKVISEEVGIDYEEALAKTRERRLMDSPRSERKTAVVGLYEVKKRDQVENKKILLVDDVSTSGATVSECSKVLINSGVTIVNVLVAGRSTEVA